MDEKIYKGVYLKFNNSDMEYLYMTTNDTVNSGDYISINEGITKVLVTKVISFTKETAPYPFDKIKSIDDLNGNTIDEITNDINVDDISLNNETGDSLTNYNYKSKDNISLDLNLIEEFSYADYHTDCVLKLYDHGDVSEFSLIQHISISNNTEECYSNISLKFVFSSDIFSMNEILLTNIKENEQVVLKTPFLKVDKEKIEKINNSQVESLRIELINEDNKILAFKEALFTVLPFSQPSKAILKEPRLYAKYITPLIPEVKQITLNAIKHNNGRPIISYQNNSKNVMLKELQAIFLALYDAKIAYQNPPVGGYYTQRIRMPKEVLNDKKGTCLDLSLLMCACLEEVGYKSLLIIIDGHAFVGAILDEALSLPYALEKKVASIYNKSTEGVRSIALIECTKFTLNTVTSFQDAMNCAVNNIKMYNGNIFYAIDVNLAQRQLFSPIDFTKQVEELEQLYKSNNILGKKIDTIKERKYVNVLRNDEKDRFTFWERKLLDLTESNPLVNFKLKLSNCVKITTDSVLYEIIQTRDKVQMLCIDFNNNISAKQIEEEFDKGVLKPSNIYGNGIEKDKLLAIGFEKTLKSLVKKSNSAMEETGAPTLYLCMGMLTYNKKKNDKGYAPFMVLPIKVTKDKMGIYYSINYDYDDIMINQTFFEYYSQLHPNVDFSQLYGVRGTDQYLDIVHTFKTNNTEDIQLDENFFFIANLTFSHYIMWLDVKKRKEELKKNKVIESMLKNRNLIGDDLNIDTNSIDSLEQYQDFAAPLYYDSTQLKAIIQCGNGKSFILDGPPGTGKSQTIVNMIVNAFYHGKTVLFIAEKKAALDVVANRLKKLGDPNSENNLGRFCLELHSNKANKSDFFSKLNKSMELGVIKNPEEFEQKCKDLDNRKDELIKVINKIHHKKYLFSLYDSINKYFELKDFEFYVQFDDSYLTSLNDQMYKDTISLIQEFVNSANNIKNYDLNPLKLIKTTSLNFRDKNKIISDFKQLELLLNDLITNYEKLIAQFKLPLDSEYNTINILFDLLNICFNKTMYSNKIYDYFNFNDSYLVNEIFNTTKLLLEIKNTLTKYIDLDKIYTIDFIGLYNGLTSSSVGGLSKFLGKIKAKKALKTIILPRVKLNKKQIKEIYELIVKYYNYCIYIRDNDTLLKALFDFDYLENINHIDEIMECYNNTLLFSTNLKKLQSNTNFMDILRTLVNLYEKSDSIVKMEYNLIKSSYDRYKTVEGEIFSSLEINNKSFKDNTITISKLYDLLDYSTNEDNFNELICISQLNNISLKLGELGLSKLVDSLTSSNFAYLDFESIYNYSLTNGYINLYFKDEDINYFNPSNFESKVREYKNLINEYNNIIISKVSAKLTKNLNHSNIEYANSSPIGRLKKTILNNGRGVTIRETLLNYDALIKKYFPCFLMSPLSAAQYLAVDEVGNRSVSKFDLVIFDEASQIPTHEAIGPIARGNSLIVAGDPEQMPPTQFFRSDVELTDDEIEFEDAESLLDECLSIELPRIRLEYHYRSKHESLINFSNHNFYNDNLRTFPSPSTSKSFITFKYVNLKECKQTSDISTEELETIMNSIKDIYNNEKTKNKSLGVIVFNMKQQEKVADYINDCRNKDKALDDAISNAEILTKEPLFVKSLENVQGDERDIIIISIGFSVNKLGRAKVNGPLIRNNGERRLNVAVSRSKERMIVVSTIRYIDFEEDSYINNKGRLLLKQFLYFAENKSFNVKNNKMDLTTSVVKSIKDDLIECGYEVDTNIGKGEFKVDIAIKNSNGDYYLLGILIDSMSIGDKYSCRDRIYVQESVLNSLKWRIINIYSLEYFKDPKATIKKIVEALDKPYVKEVVSYNPVIEKETNIILEYNTTDYKKCSSKIFIEYSNDFGYSDNVLQFIKHLINFESPVSFETIKNRIREHSNIQKMSSKATERLLYILNSNIDYKTNDQTQLFYWGNKPKLVLDKFRLSDRDIYDIPKEEVLCAMKQVIEYQQELSKEDLFKFTLSAFSYGQSTLNNKNRDRLNYVYVWAKNNKLL